MNNHNYPPKYLKLRDGSGPMLNQPIPGNGPLSQPINFPVRPEGPSYAEQARQSAVAAVQPYMDQAGPYIDKAVKLSNDYPLVGQVAQLVNQPLNLAVGVGGIAKAIDDRDVGAGIAAAVGMTPVLGKYAKGAVLAGTKRSIRQLQQLQGMGMRPSADMAATVARRVGGDAGALAQTAQLGDASYEQTNKLRGPAPGPFYGGN